MTATHVELRRRWKAATSWLVIVCACVAVVDAQERPGTRDVTWLADIQRPPAKLVEDAPQLVPLLTHAGQPITTLDGWRARRDELRRAWLEFLKLPELDRTKARAIEVLSEERLDNVIRQLVRYESEPGVSVEAYILKPTRIKGRVPGVVVFHSTVAHTIRQPAGVEGEPEKAFGLELARRGFVTICPRCFLWTEDSSISYDEHVRSFQARHPNSRGMGKMLSDGLVAVDVLAAMPEVDSQRLGAVGHSLGAKEVLYLAALDDRIRVAVSSEGGIGTRFSNWDAPWYLGPEIHSARFVREHHELLALVAPRAFLLIGGNSADGDRSWPFIEAVLPVYRLHGGTPRVGLLVHPHGHSVPPEAARCIYEWFEASL